MDEKNKGEDFNEVEINSEKENSLGESEEIETRKTNEDIKKKQNKQIAWILFLLIGLILIILLVPFINNNYLSKFNYYNLDFQKTQLGELIFYSAKIPIINIHGNVVADYSINFRKDPRKLEEIKVDIKGDSIVFRKSKQVYITLNPDMEKCENNIIAMANLAGFLINFAELEVEGASTDKDYAEIQDFPYVTCQTHPENTVIFINSGDENMIKQTGSNCYEIKYKDCEILEVSEKFIHVILENYMDYFANEENGK